MNRGLDRICLTWAKENCDRANAMRKEAEVKADKEWLFLLGRIEDACCDLEDYLRGEGVEYTKRGLDDVI